MVCVHFFFLYTPRFLALEKKVCARFFFLRANLGSDVEASVAQRHCFVALFEIGVVLITYHLLETSVSWNARA